MSMLVQKRIYRVVGNECLINHTTGITHKPLISVGFCGRQNHSPLIVSVPNPQNLYMFSYDNNGSFNHA